MTTVIDSGVLGAVSLDTTLGRCSVALQAPSAPEQELIDALRTAYGLEGSLMSRSRNWADSISRADVYAHYRTGFGPQLAEELTNYSWTPPHMLRTTERALTVPDTVGVIELKQGHALVAWIPPTAFRHHWGAPRCQVDRLVREEGRWVIQSHQP